LRKPGEGAVRLRRLLIAESQEFSAEAVRRLERFAEVTAADIHSRADLERALRDVEILWVRLRHRIDREIMASAPSLQAIATPTTGLNHIDLDAAEDLGIRVFSLRGEVDFLKEVRATAELTIGLMLALLRSVPAAFEHVLQGGWRRDAFRGRELYQKTVGIVGYGRLGRIVAGMLRAFGASVLAASPGAAPGTSDSGVEFVALDELLKRSQIVTLHVNLCRETHGFFGREKFSTMREGAWLINTSRGEVLDEAALLEALRSGRLAGAALDVLCDEDSAGMAEHPLVQYARTHANLLITPHIGGCTRESMEKTELFLAGKLAAAFGF
jgi:D-3-phosphoglycerate dehydrogenase / 2-oxoglutarate reductase